MLYLLLRLGNDGYALDARRIVEVVPMVNLKPLPHAQHYVAGLFDYRGQLVPVIDLCQLTGHRACRAYLTTRIVLVEYPDSKGTMHTLGLLAEGVTETIKIKDSDFQDGGIRLPAAPYLGELTKTEQGLVQLIEIEQLLPRELQDNLFAECA